MKKVNEKSNIIGLVVIVLSIMFIWSCGSSLTGQGGSKNGQSSGIRTISLGLPVKSNISVQDQAALAKLNAFRIIIEPTGSSCSSESIIDKLGVWDHPTLNFKVKQQCEYSIGMQLGNIANLPENKDEIENFLDSKKELDKVYFTNWTAPKQGKKLSVGTESAVKVQVQLVVTEDGKAEGFSGSTTTITPDQNNNQNTDQNIDQTGGPNITVDIPSLTLSDGAQENMWGTEDFLDHTTIWILGNSSNIKHILFAIHGDGASDYSSSTKQDRNDIAAKLPSGEGAIVAYLVSDGGDWPGFSNSSQKEKNGIALLKVFRQLEKAAGTKGIKFQQFSLSGGGRVDHALLRLILDHYDNDTSGLDLKYFVDHQLVGMHCGEALSYDLNGSTGLVQSWIDVLKRFSYVKASFILSPNSDFEYMWRKAIIIGKEFGGGDFERGGEQTLENGRIRFWGGDSHWKTWQGHFARAFFGN